MAPPVGPEPLCANYLGKAGLRYLRRLHTELEHAARKGLYLLCDCQTFVARPNIATSGARPILVRELAAPG
jgi:hypothetical protein